jgi:hypothetical protein
MRLLESRAFLGRGISVLLEDSYLSRFFVKFVEILAVSFATACSAYLIAHWVGPPPVAMPAPSAATVGSVAPTVVEAPRSSPAQAAPPVVATVDEQRPVPRPMTDAPSAPKAAKAAISVPPAALKDIKTGTAHGEKSAEALARAALANLDADRPTPADAPVRRATTGSTPVAAASIEVMPRRADMPPPASAEAPPRHVAGVGPLPPNAGTPSEIAAPAAEPPAGESRGLFSLPKRVLGLLRPDTPSLAGEAPRPPMPVGTVAPE